MVFVAETVVLNKYYLFLVTQNHVVSNNQATLDLIPRAYTDFKIFLENVFLLQPFRKYKVMVLTSNDLTYSTEISPKESS